MTEKDLRDMEAQIDGSVPYYVPALIANIRQLRRRIDAREEATLDAVESSLCDAVNSLDAVIDESRSALDRAALKSIAADLDAVHGKVQEFIRTTNRRADE